MSSRTRTFRIYSAPGVEARRVAGWVADMGVKDALQVYDGEISKRRRIGYGELAVCVHVERITKPRRKRRG